MDKEQNLKDSHEKIGRNKKITNNAISEEEEQEKKPYQ
jgi:hypothetical protein